LLRSVWGTARGPDVVAAREVLLGPLVDAAEHLLVTRRRLPPERARAVARVLAGMNVHALLELDGAAAPDEVLAALREVWERTVLDQA
jgi:hypothetical protein